MLWWYWDLWTTFLTKDRRPCGIDITVGTFASGGVLYPPDREHLVALRNRNPYDVKVWYMIAGSFGGFPFWLNRINTIAAGRIFLVGGSGFPNSTTAIVSDRIDLFLSYITKVERY